MALFGDLGAGVTRGLLGALPAMTDRLRQENAMLMQQMLENRQFERQRTLQQEEQAALDARQNRNLAAQAALEAQQTARDFYKQMMAGWESARDRESSERIAGINANARAEAAEAALRRAGLTQQGLNFRAGLQGGYTPDQALTLGGAIGLPGQPRVQLNFGVAPKVQAQIGNLNAATGLRQSQTKLIDAKTAGEQIRNTLIEPLTQAKIDQIEAAIRLAEARAADLPALTRSRIALNQAMTALTKLRPDLLKAGLDLEAQSLEAEIKNKLADNALARDRLNWQMSLKQYDPGQSVVAKDLETARKEETRLRGVLTKLEAEAAMAKAEGDPERESAIADLIAKNQARLSGVQRQIDSFRGRLRQGGGAPLAPASVGMPAGWQPFTPLGRPAATLGGGRVTVRQPRPSPTPRATPRATPRPAPKAAGKAVVIQASDWNTASRFLDAHKDRSNADLIKAVRRTLLQGVPKDRQAQANREVSQFFHRWAQRRDRVGRP